MLPKPDILNDYEHGKFVLSNLAAKRAKQLIEGALPLVQVESNHPLTIALAEIAAGKIKAIMPTVSALDDVDTSPILIEETSELGLLLPALDESEAALIGGVLAGEDDSDGDHDIEHEEGELSLADLVPDEEEEIVTPAADDDTLSLSDIADQESSDEDESEE
ncbi:MAG: DNA-directed RNA polymerase subunit omega [Fimbriimonas sp.]